MQETVERIRAFNRFYMPSMNLLGNHYLGSEYSVAEARVFFEIYEHEGCLATQIAQSMNLDKGYLSRILKAHQRDGYIYKQPCSEDGRSFRLYLTESGLARVKEFIDRSNHEIAQLLGDITPQEEAQLCAALDTITQIIGREKP